MEVNDTRKCLVTDILLNIRKLAEYIRKRKNPTWVVKWAYFQKKLSIPLILSDQYEWIIAIKSLDKKENDSDLQEDAIIFVL